jgi:hypothetical protein
VLAARFHRYFFRLTRTLDTGKAVGNDSRH